MFKRGDILLISAKFDPISWLIMLGTHSKISHTVWIIDKKWCLESVGTGIKKSPLSKYLSKKGRFLYKHRLYRLKHANKDKISQAIRYGLKLRKTRSYRVFLWSLLMIGLGRRTDKCHFSCSGFVSYCHSKVGIYFNKTKDPLDVVPGDIARSKELINVTKQLP